MRPDEQISAVIGDIYDAELDPALWTSAFDKACDYIGCAEASLFSQDNIRKVANVYFASTHQLYLEKYFKINPLFPTVLFFEAERTLSIPDVLPFEEFCQTKFSREWLAPQGFVGGIFSNLEKTTSSCALFAAFRHARHGRDDDETHRRFGLIVPTSVVPS
jgi:hypothetical protein